MPKIEKIDSNDFDFSQHKPPTSSYIFERLVAISFVILFVAIFFNTDHTESNLKNNANTLKLEDKKQYIDYVVTAKDIKMFEDIFNYNTLSKVSGNSDVKFFNDSVRKDDINNANFVDKDNNKDFTVSSKILSIDTADKNQIMKESGFSNLDYVDIVVEKTYQKGQEVYFEQQMVNVKMEDHKIITINAQKMID